MSADFNVQTFAISRRLRWIMFKARFRRWWAFRRIPKQDREMLFAIEDRIQSDLDHLIIFGELPDRYGLPFHRTYGSDLLVHRDQDQDEDESR